MYCATCGTQADEGSAFCRTCGSNLAPGTPATKTANMPPSTRTTWLSALPSAPPKGPMTPNQVAITSQPFTDLRTYPSRIQRQFIRLAISLALGGIAFGISLAGLGGGSPSNSGEIILTMLGVLVLGVSSITAIVAGVRAAILAYRWLYIAYANCYRLGVIVPGHPTLLVILGLIPLSALVVVPGSLILIAKVAASPGDWRAAPVPRLAWWFAACWAISPAIPYLIPVALVLFVVLARRLSETQVATATSLGLYHPDHNTPGVVVK